MTQDISGKVALITGASSGIGAATAKALLQAGARVAVSARRVDRLQALQSETGASDDQFFICQADIREQADARKLIDSTLAHFGRLDMLINNAGLSRGNTHDGIDPDDIRLMLDTNVFALTNLTRMALPALKKEGGDVINLSSTAALALNPGAAVYAASKAAVATFSEILRKELCNDNIRVTTIFPGLVKTEFFDSFDTEKKNRLLQMADAIDGLTAEDLAEAIVFTVTRPGRVSINELVIRPTRQLP
jgi:NADP-dependent 3-hydroxy acid dehydrogenase YdfG